MLGLGFVLWSLIQKNISVAVACQTCFQVRTLCVFCDSDLYVIFHQDGNGYIDEQELDALLKDLCDKNKMVMSLLIDWSGYFSACQILLPTLYTCVVPGRMWTWQDWGGTSPASWLCLMGGNCTALSWRSFCVGTLRSDHPAADLPSLHLTSWYNLVHVWPLTLQHHLLWNQKCSCQIVTCGSALSGFWVFFFFF